MSTGSLLVMPSGSMSISRGVGDLLGALCRCVLSELLLRLGDWLRLRIGDLDMALREKRVGDLSLRFFRRRCGALSSSKSLAEKLIVLVSNLLELDAAPANGGAYDGGGVGGISG